MASRDSKLVEEGMIRGYNIWLSDIRTLMTFYSKCYITAFFWTLLILTGLSFSRLAVLPLH
jgi:hypothetical protein